MSEQHTATTIHELAGEVDASEVYTRTTNDNEPIEAILNGIHDYEIEDEQSDLLHEMCDSLIDVYNSDLLEWVAESDHSDYVSQAIEEGIADTSDFFRMIQAGQYEWYRDIATEVIEWLQERLEEIEDERLEAGVLLSAYYIEDGEPVDEAAFGEAWDEVVSSVLAEFEEAGAGYFRATGLDQDEEDELISGNYEDENGDEFTINFVPEED